MPNVANQDYKVLKGTINNDGVITLSDSDLTAIRRAIIRGNIAEIVIEMINYADEPNYRIHRSLISSYSMPKLSGRIYAYGLVDSDIFQVDCGIVIPSDYSDDIR